MSKQLRYGENPQATAELIPDADNNDALSVFNLQNIDGTPFDYSLLSYINIADTDRLLNTITLLSAALSKNSTNKKIALAVKHGHICGAAVSDTTKGAIAGMYRGDPRAVFGGFIMTNFTFGKEEAQQVLDTAEGKTYLAGIIAPAITTEAIETLPKQKRACLYICLPGLDSLDAHSLNKTKKRRQVRGGYIQETSTQYLPDLAELGSELSGAEQMDLILAWAVGSSSVSNTITLVRDGYVIGNGVGQQDRVGAAELAIKRAHDAGHDIAGALAYSDSFFPFTDGVKVLADAGVKTIFATSGSVRDKKVIAYAKEREVKLILVPDKQARGFFGH